MGDERVCVWLMFMNIPTPPPPAGPCASRLRGVCFLHDGSAGRLVRLARRDVVRADTVARLTQRAVRVFRVVLSFGFVALVPSLRSHRFFYHTHALSPCPHHWGLCQPTPLLMSALAAQLASARALLDGLASAAATATAAAATARASAAACDAAAREAAAAESVASQRAAAAALAAAEWRALTTRAQERARGDTAVLDGVEV